MENELAHRRAAEGDENFVDFLVEGLGADATKKFASMTDADDLLDKIPDILGFTPDTTGYGQSADGEWRLVVVLGHVRLMIPMVMEQT